MEAVGYVRRVENYINVWTLDEQVSSIRKECASRGWSVHSILVDREPGEMPLHRAVFVQALDLVEQGVAEVLVVCDLFVISQSLRGLASVMGHLESARYGAIGLNRLVSVFDDFDFDSEADYDDSTQLVLTLSRYWSVGLDGDQAERVKTAAPTSGYGALEQWPQGTPAGRYYLYIDHPTNRARVHWEGCGFIRMHGGPRRTWENYWQEFDSLEAALAAMEASGKADRRVCAPCLRALVGYRAPE